MIAQIKWESEGRNSKQGSIIWRVICNIVYPVSDRAIKISESDTDGVEH